MMRWTMVTLAPAHDVQGPGFSIEFPCGGARWLAGMTSGVGYGSWLSRMVAPPADVIITAMSPAKQVARLREQIERANNAYYVQDAPEISDAEYDRLFR